MQGTVSAIIVAAGTGKRMNSAVKKQYMEIAAYPILALTLKAFDESDVDDVVVVTGKDEIEYVSEQIIRKYGIKKVMAVCAGGSERCDSVYNGIKNIIKRKTGGGESWTESCRIANEMNLSDDYVLIHDGVRPLITSDLINSCISGVRKYKACVPGVPEKDTVKEINGDMEVTKTLDRKKLYRIQTPQCFELKLIWKAFMKFNSDIELPGVKVGMTDDAMIVEEYAGQKVKIIEGDYRNIKITTPEDLDIANYFWSLR